MPTTRSAAVERAPDRWPSRVHRYSREAVSTARCLALTFVQWLKSPRERAECSQVTNHAHQPGPGRSTSDAAFTDLKKEMGAALLEGRQAACGITLRCV